MVMDNGRSLMGQYAGFVTRAVALVIDILIVIVAVLVISASISLPLDFFLGVNKVSCATQSAGASVVASWGFLRSALCNVVDWTLVLVAVMTGPVYFIFLSTAGGQTIGKYVMGVRIVRTDGRQMSYIKALVRYLGYFVSLATLGLGFLWVVFDGQRRALHDHMAGTCVIYSWRAQQNNLLLNRLQRLFGKRVKQADRQSVVAALSTHSNDLVTLSVPGYDDLRALLRIVQNGRQNGLFNILGMLEYAKDTEGHVNRIDDDELAEDEANSQRIVDEAGFTRKRIDEIRDGIPNDHFALVVVARDDDIDAVVKLVSQRTSALVRRYDLGQQTPSTVVDQRLPAAPGNGATGQPPAQNAPALIVAAPVAAAASQPQVVAPPATATRSAGTSVTPAQPAAPAPQTPAIVAEAPAPAAESVSVGQKAIFYEERTGAAEGSANAGAVVWSVVQESPGDGLPAEPVIRAEATIAERDLKMRLTIRRNADKTLPASHIFEILFLTDEKFTSGPIDTVLRVTFKDREESAGNPLLGVPAKIADGFFLVALTEGAAEVETNTTLMRRDQWIDIPIVYSSGRRALVTIEKGIPGDKAFDEALKAWGAKASG